MIDLNFLRSNPKEVVELIKKKEPSFNVGLLVKLDEEKRNLQQEVEDLRHKKNDLAQKAKSGITEEIRKESIEIGKILKEKEKELQKVEINFTELYLSCPNIPMKDVPVGNKDKNEVVKTFGKKPEFKFEIKNHLELGNNLGWFDFDAAAKMTGSNFVLYKGDAVKLIYSLTNYFIKNNMLNGYELILPPYLVNAKSLVASGNFPKFKDQVYSIPEDELFLIPTAEVSLTNLYRDNIFLKEELPVRMSSWTSCFRREAGAYGSTERGLIRIHQFEKVELYTICEPEESNKELDKMISCAENILQKLNLHYRISLLAAEDCSFASAKTYDIEVWLPGQNAYYEVASCSNCTDFQARRAFIRFRENLEGKIQLVHTLNASSLAIPRLMAAIMEVYQQADGTIKIPDILIKEGLF